MITLAPLRIALIGGGNMARGLLGGLLGGDADPALITVTAASEATRAALARDYGVAVSADNAAAVRDARVVVLAVKPQLMGEVVRALAPALRASRPLVISVAAGIPCDTLTAWIGGDVPVVRAMPNRPALLGAGASGLYADRNVGSAERALAAQVVGATGLALWVSAERDLDLVTALSGSGPAYFFRLAELMAEAAVAEGLDPAVANRLAAQTLAGAGRMVAAETAPDLAAMRAAVSSKGGTTAAALAQLDALALPTTVAAAMRAAATRSRELAEQYGKP
ncbi:MAG TPA: pyrroline-5-carboxylate reductase [Steroidobacteraceae bacterium]|nr:pyrroline-5-carboxylate reductase [Steroidobacteraceae bacterium]